MDIASDNSCAKHVLCLPGSLRSGSLNRRLLMAAKQIAHNDLNLALYDELASVPMFNEDVEQPVPPGVEHLRRAVAAADGLLIASPEYNHSFPGVLKNAIDWLSRGSDSVLIDKPVAVIGATVGGWGTRLAQAGLRQVLTATESRVMPAPMLFIARASECFDVDGRLCNPAEARALSGVITAFRDWIGLCRPAITPLKPECTR